MLQMRQQRAKTPQEKREDARMEAALENLVAAIKTNQVDKALTKLRENGDKLFYFAAINNKLKSVQYILDFCAHWPPGSHPPIIFDLTNNSFSEDGYSCLSDTIASKYFDVADALISDMIRRSDDINPPDRDGNGLTPLHHACRTGQLSLVKKIVNALRAQGLEINPPNAIGITPQYFAAIDGHTHILKYLNQYLDPNPLLPNKDDKKPLIYFTFRDFPIFKVTLAALEEKKLNVNPVFNNSTLMNTAAAHPNIKFLELLLNTLERLNQDFNVECGNAKLTPLVVALSHGHVEHVELLLEKLKAHNIAINYQEYFMMACRKNHYDVAVIFLKEIPLNQEINFMTEAGKTVLEIAISSNNKSFLDNLITAMIKRWQSEYSIAERKERWGDICMSLAFTNQSERLLELLEHFPANKESNAYVIAFEYIGLYKKYKMADQLVSYLKNDLALERILGIVSEAQENSQPNNLSPVIASLHREINDLVNEKIDILNSLLPDTDYSEAMLGNELILRDVKIEHDKLKNNIEIQSEYIKQLPTAMIKKQFPDILRSLNHQNEVYENFKRVFLSEEKKKKDQLLAELEPFKQDLDFFREKIQAPFKAVKDQTLLEQQTLLNEAITQCDLEIEASQLKLSPTIKSTFESARQQVRSAQLLLIVFQGEQDNKRTEAAKLAAQAQIEAASKEAQRQHQEMIEQIKSQRNNSLSKIETLSQFIQTSPYQTQFQSEWEATLAELSNLKETALSLKSPEEIDQIKNKHEAENLLDHFSKLHDEFTKIRARIKNHIKQAQAEEIKTQRLQIESLSSIANEKRNEIQKILSLVVKHAMHKQVLADPQNELHTRCRQYQSLYEKMMSPLISPEALNEAIEFYNRRINKLDLWIKEHACEVAHLQASLDLFSQTQLHNPALTILHPAANDAAAAPSAPLLFRSPQSANQSKKRGAKKLPSLLRQLALSCEPEIKNCQEILHIVTESKESLEIKSNALLLSIAMLFEEMQDVYKTNRLKTKDTGLDQIINIRNAIFHSFQKENLTQEQYEQLYNFANTLQALIQSNESWDACLSSFFDIMPLQQQPPAACVVRINDHIARLKWYISAIENGKIDLSNNIIARFNITLLVGQFNASLSDLKSHNQANPDKAINRAIGKIHKEILTELHMGVFTARLTGNDARHGGPEAVLRVADKFLLDAVTRVSELSEQKEAAEPIAEALAHTFSHLTFATKKRMR